MPRGWISPGAATAIVAWVIATGAFGVYVSNFASYDATYGALAGFVVFLHALWIGHLALLMVGLPLLLLASSDQGGPLWTVAYLISAAGCVGHTAAAVSYAWQAWHLVYRPQVAPAAD